MARQRKDRIGWKYGRLKVLRIHHVDHHRVVHYTCQCDCGKTTVVSIGALTTGTTRSCGCLRKELARERMKGSWQGGGEGG